MSNNELHDILSYLESETPLPKIVVVYGPTACGKSSLAVNIALSLRTRGYGSEIISADSRQIYSWLDIGTGKVTTDEMQWIPHHMLDVISPDITYSMVDYRKWVDTLELWQDTHIIPILCGWTGLYIDAVLYDMDYPDTPPDWEYRAELEAIRTKYWDQRLWDMLYQVDPTYASELEVENYRYVMRGLEVMRATGRSKKDAENTKKLRFSPYFITPYTDSVENRKQLYANIDKRVESMFNYWLLEEVIYNETIYSDTSPGLSTIGYKEVCSYLRGESTLEVAKALVAQHSRNYAKRQITWNKKYAFINSTDN